MRKKVKKEKRRLTFRRRFKVILFMIVCMIVMGLLGYGAALFGGKLIVDQAGMVLDETTIIEKRIKNERLHFL